MRLTSVFHEPTGLVSSANAMELQGLDKGCWLYSYSHTRSVVASDPIWVTSKDCQPQEPIQLFSAIHSNSLPTWPHPRLHSGRGVQLTHHPQLQPAIRQYSNLYEPCVLYSESEKDCTFFKKINERVQSFRTPVYRTGVKLSSIWPILYLFNKYPYWIF